VTKISVATITNDPTLTRLRCALDELYGNRIERVVLFGSRARGDFGEDSDYDLAVFLHDLTDRWHELDRLADLRADFLEDAGLFIDAKPYPAGAYRDRTTLMREIRRDGVDL
jgi:predicted nucleotidyltransferase